MNGTQGFARDTLNTLDPSVAAVLQRRMASPAKTLKGFRDAIDLLNGFAQWNKSAAQTASGDLESALRKSWDPKQDDVGEWIALELALGITRETIGVDGSWMDALNLASTIDRAPIVRHPGRGPMLLRNNRKIQDAANLLTRWLDPMGFPHDADFLTLSELAEDPSYVAVKPHVIGMLANKQSVGTAEARPGGYAHLGSQDLYVGNSSSANKPMPLRVCDLYAWHIARAHQDAPTFTFWASVREHDASIAQLRAWLE
jgi:hypothetical protein